MISMFRYSLAVLAAVFFISFSSAHAADGDNARQFIDGLGKKILAVVNTSSGEQEKQAQLRQMFTENVDIEWMGRFVLGRSWSLASEEQRGRYLQAYREYLLKRYTTNFADYAGSKYTITGVKNEAEGQFTVAMDVESPGAKEQQTRAGYRVHAANGQYKIIDIIIEGVSLITTERSEFGAVVQKDGIDKLIEQLQNKA